MTVEDDDIKEVQNLVLIINGKLSACSMCIGCEVEPTDAIYQCTGFVLKRKINAAE